MLKISKKILLLFLMFATLDACKNVDFGEVNVNENGAASPDAAGLLAGAIMRYGTYSGRNGLTRPTLYVQYQSQVTYTSESRYDEVPAGWGTYYVSILNNLQSVIELNENEENHTATLLSQGDPANQIGVSKIMKAIVFKRVTDTYGDVSFTEALLGNAAPTPSYDTQESIYKSILEDLKTGRDMLDASKLGPTGDILFQGNVAAWKKMANSILLQASLQLSKKYPSASGMAATEFKAALSHGAGVIETLSDEAWFVFEDVTDFRNPWFALRTADYFLSKELTDALNGNTGTGSLSPTSNSTYDSRLKVYGTSPTADGVPYGYSDESGANKNQMSTDYYWNASSSLPIMTAAYTFLNRAEAANLGWTSEDAQAMLTSGITLSFESLEDHSDGIENIAADAAAYAAARIVDIGTVPGGLSQVIGEEKWVGLYGAAFDAWAEWRRTGYPNLVPATDYLNNGNIPRRYLYPTEESTLNNSNYKIGVSALVPAEDHNTSKVWWDQ